MQPKTINIIGFLESKGWAIAEVSPKYIFLTPPEDVEFEKKDFRLRVPRFEGGKDTPEYLLRLTFNLAKMYDLDKYELLEMLSKGERELKFEIARQKELLAMKESYLRAIAKAS